jgi:hypothetical protein
MAITLPVPSWPILSELRFKTGSSSGRQPIVPQKRIFILAFVLSCSALATSAGPCVAVSTSPTEIAQLRVEVRELKTQLTDQTEAHASQANAFTADATDISIAGALSVLLVTLGGLVVAFLGYRFIQSKVGEHLRCRPKVALGWTKSCKSLI